MAKANSPNVTTFNANNMNGCCVAVFSWTDNKNGHLVVSWKMSLDILLISLKSGEEQVIQHPLREKGP